MDSTTVVWIVVVIVAIIVIAVLVFAALNRRKQRRHDEAERIREDITTHTAKVDRRQTVADETAARARAAAAEADAKAAEAARLQDRAADHREAVSSSREDIEERRKYADHLDPKTRVQDDADVAKDQDATQRGAEQRAGQPRPPRHEADRM